MVSVRTTEAIEIAPGIGLCALSIVEGADYKEAETLTELCAQVSRSWEAEVSHGIYYSLLNFTQEQPRKLLHYAENFWWAVHKGLAAFTEGDLQEGKRYTLTPPSASEGWLHRLLQPFARTWTERARDTVHAQLRALGVDIRSTDDTGALSISDDSASKGSLSIMK